MSQATGEAVGTAVLKVKSGPMAGQTLPMEKGEATIGRSRSCSLRVEGYEELSREHARLAWDGNSLTIEDLGSRNGVLVDGKSIQTAKLRSGSVVELGDFAAEVVLPDAAKPAPRLDDGEQKRSGQGYTTMIRTLTDSQRQMQEKVRRWSAVGACLLLFGLYLALRPHADPRTLADDVEQRVKEATVYICSNVGNGIEQGSGFLVGPRMIMTNRHVVSDEQYGSTSMTSFNTRQAEVVFFSGSGHEKKMIVKPDHMFVYGPKDSSDMNDIFHTDLAVLLLPEDAPVAPLSIGDTSSLRLTEGVFVVGFPLGVGIDLQHKFVQRGEMVEPERFPVASVMPHNVERMPKTGEEIDLLQLGGSATHGNSGGPVVNSRGEVVAVIRMGRSLTNGQELTIGLNIPTGYIKAMLKKVEEAVNTGHTSSSS